MLNSTVFHLLGWAIACLSVLMAAASLMAVGFGEPEEAGVLLVSMAISGFLAGALVIGFRGRAERLSRLHVSVFVVAVWVLLPVVAAIPMYMLGGFARIDLALFEAVSGVTTTGMTVVGDLSQAPSTLIFWRAILQWFGGALTLMTAVVVLAPFGILSVPINITIPGYEREDFAKSVYVTGRHILPAYALLTACCMLALWFCGIDAFEALCLALSTISTGGFMPRAGNISDYSSFAGEAVLMVFMLAGATSILAHRAMFLRVPGTHKDNHESIYLLLKVIVVSVVLTILFALSTGAASGLEAMRAGAFRAVSLITTTGFDNAGAGLPGVPFAIVLALCSIGGASFSTAGGLKIFRVFSMATQAHRELKRLIHPRGITQAKSAGKPIDIQIMKTIWSMFFVFLIAVGTVSVVLGAEGLPVEEAVIAAVASLSNTGAALEMTALGASKEIVVPYSSMSRFPLIVLSGAMVLGRIEFVVLLSLALAVVLRR